MTKFDEASKCTLFLLLVVFIFSELSQIGRYIHFEYKETHPLLTISLPEKFSLNDTQAIPVQMSFLSYWGHYKQFNGHLTFDIEEDCQNIVTWSWIGDGKHRRYGQIVTRRFCVDPISMTNFTTHWVRDSFVGEKYLNGTYYSGPMDSAD